MGVLPESRADMYHRSVPIVIENAEEAAQVCEDAQKTSKTIKQKKIEVLESIRRSVFPIKQRIDEVVGSFEDKEYLDLQDQLEKAHIALDNVEANGDDEVRKTRKSIVMFVSEVLKILDAKSKRAVEDSVINGSTKCEEIEKKIDQETFQSDNDSALTVNSKDLENDCNKTRHQELTEIKSFLGNNESNSETDSKNESPNPLKIKVEADRDEQQSNFSNIRVIPIIKVEQHINEFDEKEVQKHAESYKEVPQEKFINDSTKTNKEMSQEKSLNDANETKNEVTQIKSLNETNNEVAQDKSLHNTIDTKKDIDTKSESQNTTKIENETIKPKLPTSPYDMRVIPVVKIDKPSSEFDTKQVITDNSRIQMKVIDNCVNLVVHVKDFVNDDLKVGFDECDMIVTGRNGDKTVVMTKTVPSDCVPDKAVSQLTTDGILIVKVPRRRRNLQPVQMGRHQFKF